MECALEQVGFETVSCLLYTQRAKHQMTKRTATMKLLHPLKMGALLLARSSTLRPKGFSEVTFHTVAITPGCFQDHVAGGLAAAQGKA